MFEIDFALGIAAASFFTMQRSEIVKKI